MKNGLIRSVLPYRDELFAPIEQQFDKFFSDFFQRSTSDAVRAGVGYPKLDIMEDRDNFIIRAALPGVKLENLSVELTPEFPAQDYGSTGSPKTAASIRISGEMSDEYSSAAGTSYYHKELHKSRFSRIVQLPDYLLEEEPQTTLQDGILTLKWKVKPSIQTTSTPKKLKINTG